MVGRMDFCQNIFPVSYLEINPFWTNVDHKLSLVKPCPELFCPFCHRPNQQTQSMDGLAPSPSSPAAPPTPKPLRSHVHSPVTVYTSSFEEITKLLKGFSLKRALLLETHVSRSPCQASSIFQSGLQTGRYLFLSCGTQRSPSQKTKSTD